MSGTTSTIKTVKTMNTCIEKPPLEGAPEQILQEPVNLSTATSSLYDDGFALTVHVDVTDNDFVSPQIINHQRIVQPHQRTGSHGMTEEMKETQEQLLHRMPSLDVPNFIQMVTDQDWVHLKAKIEQHVIDPCASALLMEHYQGHAQTCFDLVEMSRAEIDMAVELLMGQQGVHAAQETYVVKVGNQIISAQLVSFWGPPKFALHGSVSVDPKNVQQVWKSVARIKG